MRKLRALIEGPAGRWIMLGMLVFFLVIFTVTAEMEDVIRGLFSDRGPTQADVAGSFSVLKGERVDVTYRDYDAAKQRYYRAMSFLMGASEGQVGDTDVWTHLLLLEMARKEGIRVADDEVADVVQARVSPGIWADPERYKLWVRTRYRVPARELEEAVRDVLTAWRVRQLYVESFAVGPATTREKATQDYASQNLEYVRADVAALPAARFLQDAGDELKAETDPEAKLQEFYETDPAVKAEDDQFRNPRRYRLEVLYTIHRRLDEEAYGRIEALFRRAYPQLDVGKLEPTVKDAREYFGIYRDRLLEEAGTSWEKETQKERDRRAAEDGTEEEAGDGDASDGGTPPENGGDPDGAGDEEDDGSADGTGGEAGDEAGNEAADGTAADGTGEEAADGAGDGPEDMPQSIREAVRQVAFQLVREQVQREIRLRGMYQWFHAEATREGDTVSLKKLFDTLKKHDDPENPVCATEPGKGLIVYRDFGGEPLTGDGLADIEDSGVRFTYNFRVRVNGVGDTDLPKISPKADVLGEAGHGRQIFRLLEVQRPSRKTFSDLTEGEKEDLRDDWYLPAKARERAKERLEALRTKLVDGELAADAFAGAAKELGCRFHENEWIEASRDFMAEPDPSMYWPDAYEHMRDRHFLHGELASVLGRDRAKNEIGAGTFLDVLTDARRGEDDPGACYLVRVRERRRPDAQTIPPDELDLFLRYAQNTRQQEQQERWTEKIEILFSDFDFEFEGDMERRIQDELKRMEEAKRRRAGLPG